MKFDEVIKSLEEKKCQTSLLMGNGFSMAFNEKIFSYNALSDFLYSKDNAHINKLFEAVKTKNFELVMQQLNTTLALIDAFGADDAFKAEIKKAAENLKNGLITSIKELHPEHVFKVGEEKSIACAKFFDLFLSSDGHLFTTNYDLLLYWVLMRQGASSARNHIDGFGRDQEGTRSELIWGPNTSRQNIHYLHGALHIFDSKAEIVKERCSLDAHLLQNVQERLDNGKYPIFVTAGNGDEKLEHIRHNRYLSFCYDQLSKVNGSLVTFGFQFGQSDEHIIKAINRAHHRRSKDEPKLWSVYIGTYSEADVAHIKSIEHKFHPEVYTYDAKTAHIWG